MIVFDGHNDTLTHLSRKEKDPVQAFIQGTDKGHVDLPRARAGKLAGAFFAIFTPPPAESPEQDSMYGLEFTDDGYIMSERSPIDPDYAQQFTDTIITQARQIEASANGQVEIVSDYARLQTCIETDVFAMLLHMEGAEAIRPDLSNLPDYVAQGVRSIGPVWSRRNAFGYGVPFRFPGTPDIGPGLTDAGKVLIHRCNELGVMVDLAHINLAGFRDVAAISSAPLVVTHADVHAICPSTRNLTNEQIDTIADSGGVIGVNFETLNTHPQSRIDHDVPVTQVTAHINYIARRVGVDHVAFGSDFDGADMPDSIRDVTGLQNVVAALEQHGYSHTDVEKITCRNWLRVIEATWQL